MKFLARYSVIAFLQFLLCQVPLAAGQAEAALMMPLANKSLLLDLASAGDHLVAVGERGHILISDAAGQDWTQVPSPTAQMLTGVHFVDAMRGWVVGHDGLILATEDGGKSWSLQYSGLQQQGVINQAQLAAMQDRKTLLEREIAEQEDAQRRAQQVAELEEVHLDIEDAEYALAQPPHSPPLLAVYFSNPLAGHAVGAFGEYLHTRDGGVTWQRHNLLLDNPEQMHLNAITGDRDKALWIAGEGGLLFRSMDAGESWQLLASPYHGSFFDIAYQPSTGALIVAGLRGNIFISNDKGATWRAATVASDRSLAGVTWLNDRYAAAVGAVGNLQFSNDGGSTFSDHSLPERTGLSAVIHHRGRLVVAGQGGIYSFRDLGAFSD